MHKIEQIRKEAGLMLLCAIAPCSSELIADDKWHGQTRVQAFTHGLPASRYGKYVTVRSVARAAVVLVAPKDQLEPIRTAAANSSPIADTMVIAKHFFPKPGRVSIQSGQLQLDRFHATLYSDGNIIITGRLSFDGGKDKKDSGANACIAVRSFIGQPQSNGLAQNAMQFQTTQTIWVPRDETISLSLLPPPQRSCPASLRRSAGGDIASPPLQYGSRPGLQILSKSQFSQITHIELELIHQHAR